MTRYQVTTYDKTTGRIETITRSSYSLRSARQVADHLNETERPTSPSVHVVVPRL